MYRSSNDYDKMAQLVIDIFIDYNISGFPIDEKEICRKLGLKLVPYSAYSEQDQILLKKGLLMLFSLPLPNTLPRLFSIMIKSYERQRYSIFHEVKHYVNNDSDDCEYNDEMADYFARYIMCPIPYLIKANINDALTLISDHRVSAEAAHYAIKNVRNRKAKYGDRIFDYEQPLIDLLL